MNIFKDGGEYLSVRGGRKTCDIGLVVGCGMTWFLLITPYSREPKDLWVSFIIKYTRF